FEGLAAVNGTEQASVGDVNLVGVLGVGPDVGKIPGALTEAVIVVDERPIGAAIIAAVEDAFLGFDQRINDIGIGAGNGAADFSERAFGEAVAFKALPGSAVVARTEEAVLGAAAVERPRGAIAFPHGGEKDMGILRIENDFNGAGAVVKIEHFLPRLTAVARTVNAAIG